MRLLVTMLGLFGFAGLLLASSAYPASATLLRELALVWFFAFGAVRVAVGRRPNRRN
jgi:hypothetical protein